jgi:hypothetical protein
VKTENADALLLSLAYCEPYIGLAALVLRVFPHMHLYQTTVYDVKYDHDVLLGVPMKGSKGIRATVVLDEKAWGPEKSVETASHVATSNLG